MKFVLTATVLALLLLPGCKEDKPPCVDCPVVVKPRPTLSNIWPNDDQRFWSYAYGFEEVQTPGDFAVYESPYDIPPFSWDDVRSLLPGHELDGTTEQTTGTYWLQFDGEMETQSGATGQYLRVVFDPEPPILPAAIQVAGGDAFLARLYMARPDLRPAILEKIAQTRQDVLAPDRRQGPTFYEPLLLHGGAWEKTSKWIGGYGDLNQSLAWMYLSADLSVGSEFTLQLVPDLADDVYLHGRIERRTAWIIQDGNREALDVHYVIDYGTTVVFDNQTPIGYFRVYDCGQVVYAPRVGPVYMYEIGMIEPGDPPSNGLRATELRLAATGLPEF